MSCLKGSPNSEIKCKGRLQWTGTVMRHCGGPVHYLNITPKHLIFTSSPFSCVSVEEQLYHRFVFFANWLSVYDNLWIPSMLTNICWLWKSVYFSNIHIDKWRRTDKTLLFHMYGSELHTLLKKYECGS